MGGDTGVLGLDTHGLTLAGFVLGTLVCWAIWGIFDKKALASLTPVETLILTYAWYLPATIIAIPVSLCFLHPAFSPIMLLITAVASFCNGLSILAYLRALSLSEASYVLGITAGYPMVMQFLALWILHEKLIAARIVGSVGITLGIFLIGFSRPADHKERGARFMASLCVCLLIATFGWGLTAILDKLAIDISDAAATFDGRLLWNAAFFLATVAVWFNRGHRLKLSVLQSWQYPVLSSFCLIGGLLCYMGALSLATASYVVVITSCYPLLTYLFAVYLLGERWNRQRFLGVSVLVAGAAITQSTANL